MLIYLILTEKGMKSIRLIALTLVTLMLFSVLGSFSSTVVEPNDQPIELEEE